MANLGTSLFILLVGFISPELEERLEESTIQACGVHDHWAVGETFHSSYYKDDDDYEALKIVSLQRFSRSTIMSMLLDDDYVKEDDRKDIIEMMDEVKFEDLHKGDTFLMEKVDGDETRLWLATSDYTVRVRRLSEELFDSTLKALIELTDEDWQQPCAQPPVYFELDD